MSQFKAYVNGVLTDLDDIFHPRTGGDPIHQLDVKYTGSNRDVRQDYYPLLAGGAKYPFPVYFEKSDIDLSDIFAAKNTVQPPSPVNPPTNVQYNCNTQIVTWTHSVDYPNVTYIIERSNDNWNSSEVVVNGLTVTSYSVPKYPSGITSVRIAAVQNSGISTYSTNYPQTNSVLFDYYGEPAIFKAGESTTEVQYVNQTITESIGTQLGWQNGPVRRASSGISSFTLGYKGFFKGGWYQLTGDPWVGTEDLYAVQLYIRAVGGSWWTGPVLNCPFSGTDTLQYYTMGGLNPAIQYEYFVRSYRSSRTITGTTNVNPPNTISWAPIATGTGAVAQNVNVATEIKKYNILSNTWSSITTRNFAPKDFNSATNDGEAFRVGDSVYFISDSGSGTTSVHAFNLQTNVWSSKATGIFDRIKGSSTVYNGKIYCGSLPTNSIREYNPVTNTWRNVGPANLDAQPTIFGYNGEIGYTTGAVNDNRIDFTNISTGAVRTLTLSQSIEFNDNQPILEVINNQLILAGGGNTPTAADANKIYTIDLSSGVVAQTGANNAIRGFTNYDYQSVVINNAIWVHGGQYNPNTGQSGPTIANPNLVKITSGFNSNWAYTNQCVISNATVDCANKTISWTALPGVTSYRVEADTDLNFGSPDWNTITSNTSVSIPQFGGTATYYRIVPLNGPPNSSIVAGNTCTLVMPAPVVTVNGVTTSSITVSTNIVANAGRYRIEYKQGTGGTWTLLADQSTQIINKVLSSLPHNTTYYFRAKVWHNVVTTVDSAWSAEVSATTLQITVPNMTNVKATDYDEDANARIDGILISWDAKTGIDGYKIYRNGTLVNTITNNNTTSWLDTDTTPVVNYNYSVRGYVGAINGNLSISDLGQRDFDFSLYQPRFNTSPRVLQAQLIMTWSPIPIEGYSRAKRVDFYNYNGGNPILVASTNITQPYNGTNITGYHNRTEANYSNSTQYFCRVVGFNNTETNNSVIRTRTVHRDLTIITSGSAPINTLTSTLQSNGTNIVLNWGAVDDVQNWRLYRKTTNSIPARTDTPLTTISGGTLTYTDTPPVAGITYYYWIEGTNGDGSDWTNPALGALGSRTAFSNVTSKFIPASCTLITDSVNATVAAPLNAGIAWNGQIASVGSPLLTSSSTITNLEFDFRIAGDLQRIGGTTPWLHPPVNLNYNIWCAWKVAGSTSGYTFVRVASGLIPFTLDWTYDFNFSGKLPDINTVAPVNYYFTFTINGDGGTSLNDNYNVRGNLTLEKTRTTCSALPDKTRRTFTDHVWRTPTIATSYGQSTHDVYIPNKTNTLILATTNHTNDGNPRRFSAIRVNGQNATLLVGQDADTAYQYGGGAQIWYIDVSAFQNSYVTFTWDIQLIDGIASSNWYDSIRILGYEFLLSDVVAVNSTQDLSAPPSASGAPGTDIGLTHYPNGIVVFAWSTYYGASYPTVMNYQPKVSNTNSLTDIYQHNFAFFTTSQNAWPNSIVNRQGSVLAGKSTVSSNTLINHHLDYQLGNESRASIGVSIQL